VFEELNLTSPLPGTPNAHGLGKRGFVNWAPCTQHFKGGVREVTGCAGLRRNVLADLCISTAGSSSPPCLKDAAARLGIGASGCASWNTREIKKQETRKKTEVVLYLYLRNWKRKRKVGAGHLKWGGVR